MRRNHVRQRHCAGRARRGEASTPVPSSEESSVYPVPGDATVGEADGREGLKSNVNAEASGAASNGCVASSL